MAFSINIENCFFFGWLQDLPHDRYRGVLVLLAEAYVKQRWFQEAQRVLDLLASEPLQALASASIDTSVQATMR